MSRDMTMQKSSTMFIRQPALYGDIKSQIATLWGIKKRLTHNPSPNPIALNRKHLPLLRNTQYVVAEKTNGVRYLLLISKFTAGKRPFAVMVDRAFKMFQVQVCAPHYIYKGSLFDGELVWDEVSGCMKFLVFDVMAYGGKSVSHYYFLQRYEIINQAFLSAAEWNKSHIKEYSVAVETAGAFAAQKKIVCIPERGNLLFLYSKPCVLFKLFGSLIRTKLTHSSDGYIFTPVKCPVKNNAHLTMFKWKDEPTIDVLIKEHNQYFCGDGKEIVELCYVFPEYTFIFEKTRGLVFSRKDSFIIETTIREKSNKPGTFICQFHRIRTDKKNPNNKRTIEGIISEIRENITVDELLALSQETIL